MAYNIKCFIKKHKKRLIIVVAFVLFIGILAFAAGSCNLKNKNITMADICKAVAYAGGYKEKTDDGQYWYSAYVDFCSQQGIFEKIKPNEAFTGQRARELIKYIEEKNGVTIDKETKKKAELKVGSYTSKEFAAFFIAIKDYFASGSSINSIKLSVAAVPDNTNELENWTVCTDKGNYTFKGLRLSGKLDHMLEVITFNNEILMVVDDISKDITYKNVWINKYEENVLYLNIYGVPRTFKVGGVSEQVGSILADITLNNGKITNIDTKSDVISGKVLSAGDGYVEVSGYGRVPVDEDFVMYNVADNTADRNYEDIIIGYDLQDFIVAAGKICGAIVSEGLTVGNIRVLIKTTGFTDIFHENVSITCDTSYTISSDDESVSYEAGEKAEFNRNDERLSRGRLIVEPDIENAEIKLESIKRSQGNPSYEGAIELSLQDGGIVIINEVDLEKYLERVVPSEMPVSFGVEALKVQAVCARSYAYRHLTNVGYGSYGAHVDDSTKFQVYNNTKEQPASNEAILATKGQLLKYNDEVIQAYYYSTSCGIGADVSLWGSNPQNYPYYISKDLGENNRQKNYSDENVFREFIMSEDEADYDSKCDYYRWKMNVSAAKLSESFNNKLQSGILENAPDNIGTIKNINIKKRVSCGAAVCVEVEGSNGSVILETESVIRKMLGVADEVLMTNGGETKKASLPSAFIVIDKNTMSDGTEGFQITGGGYGHGIGMSQNSVNSMVKKGMDYKSILQFFYTGTTVS